MNWDCKIEKMQEEDYANYFFNCSYLTRFCQQIYDLLKKSNLDFSIKLKHLIFGYKITDNKYNSIIFLITIISFSIYKSYYKCMYLSRKQKT